MVAQSDAGREAHGLPPTKELHQQAERARQRSRQVRANALQLRHRTEELLAEVRASFGDGSRYLATIEELQGELAGLREAMSTRATIEQAKGILMAREHCNAEEAFEILVKASQREHVKLRDLAHQLVMSADQKRLKSV